LRRRKYKPDLCCLNALLRKMAHLCRTRPRWPLSLPSRHPSNTFATLKARIQTWPLRNIRSIGCLWTPSSTLRSAPPSIYASTRLNQTLAPLSRVRICTMVATRDLTAVPEVEPAGPITGVDSSEEGCGGDRGEGREETSKNVEDEWAITLTERMCSHAYQVERVKCRSSASLGGQRIVRGLVSRSWQGQRLSLRWRG